MTTKKIFKLSKAARGMQPGDVANSAIRNILATLSGISYEDVVETEEYFEWKCPYTGVDLRERIINKDNVALDHIVPQNKQCCGLNVKGNLVWVDAAANSAKHNKSVEDFLLNDKKVLKDTPEEIRKERLQKIKNFQRECGYDPDEVKRKLGAELETIYKGTADRQLDLVMALRTVLESEPGDYETEREDTKEKSNKTKSKIKRHTEKYILDGIEYSKRGLALFVVEDYVRNNANSTYDDLMRTFDMKLSFDGKPIIRLADSVSEKERNSNRVYWKNPIHLADKSVVVVNTQWQKDDMPYFLKIVEKLGYEVISEDD